MWVFQYKNPAQVQRQNTLCLFVYTLHLNVHDFGVWDSIARNICFKYPNKLHEANEKRAQKIQKVPFWKLWKKWYCLLRGRILDTINTLGSHPTCVPVSQGQRSCI